MSHCKPPPAPKPQRPSKLDDFGQVSIYNHHLDDSLDLSISTEIQPTPEFPSEYTDTPKVLITPCDTNNLDLSEKEKIDRMLSCVSIESDVMSEDLLMNENIDFLYEQNSETRSIVSSSLNYTASDMPASTLDTFAFSSIQHSMSRSQNESSVFNLNRFQTQQPDLSVESRNEMGSGVDYKNRALTYSEIGERGDVRQSCEVMNSREARNSREVRNSKEKSQHCEDEGQCCRGCVVI